MMVAAVGIFSLSQWPIIALRVSLCRSIGGGEQNTANLRMEVTAAYVALETIDEGHTVTIYSDSSYLINCMRRSWYKEWRENDWLNHLKAPVANRDLWERLLEATQRHQEVRWRKVKGHSKTTGPHKTGDDRADALAVAAKWEAAGNRASGPRLPEGREAPKLAGEASQR